MSVKCAPKLVILALFVLVLTLPLMVRAFGRGRVPSASRSDHRDGGLRLVIVTPHVAQIRSEFARGFSEWHQRHHGTPVEIDWRVPGGTSEIIKTLEAQFDSASARGRLRPDGSFEPGTSGFDVFFGGGSFEHGKMKQDRTVPGADGSVKYRMGKPAGFSGEQLNTWFGENKIGTQFLYDPDQYWIGTALSGFGIVYNRLVLKDLGLPEPRTFSDLGNPRYQNMLALADGRLSGSLTTTYESILNKEGWDRGWRTLRELCANARYFASASTKPPVDVGQGEAAAGLAIDFYGRGQSQFLLQPGQAAHESRVGYVDPEGAVYIDADPVSILNGAANLDLAKQFVEFCLTEDAQALWQFPLRSKAVSGTPRGESGEPMGPVEYELRRMPVRRLMYEHHGAFLIDKENPFTLASDVPGRGWRSAIAPLMAAFGIDTAEDCRAAWAALNRARSRAGSPGGFPPDKLAEIERLFYAFPPHTMRDGSVAELSEANFKAIKDDTQSWKDTAGGQHAKETLIAYARFFTDNYRRVVRMESEAP